MFPWPFSITYIDTFHWLESDGAQVFFSWNTFVFNLLPQADVSRKQNKLLLVVLVGVFIQGHGRHPTRRTAGTKPKSDRTSKCLSIGERSFLLFQQADSALTSLNAQRGENMLWLHHWGRLRILEPVCPLMLRDAYHCCCFWQWALISSFFPPLMLQNYPEPYQAGPSQRLECKHTAVAHRASVWALQDPTANISKRTCWFKEQTQGRLVKDLSLDYVHDFRLNHLDFMFVLIANYS